MGLHCHYKRGVSLMIVYTLCKKYAQSLIKVCSVRTSCAQLAKEFFLEDSSANCAHLCTPSTHFHLFYCTLRTYCAHFERISSSGVLSEYCAHQNLPEHTSAYLYTLCTPYTFCAHFEHFHVYPTQSSQIFAHGRAPLV